MKKKKTLVIGLGISGFAAARFLLARDFPVIAIDSGDSEPLRDRAETLRGLGAEVHLGAADPSVFETERVVASPGVPPRLLKPFLDRKVPVIGELELGCREVKEPIVAVTGTNGKSTVVETIDRGLNDSGRVSFALGNLGTPITEWVDSGRTADWLTLEVSSYQLETIDKFRPSVAVILNIAPDHLSWHGSMENYLKAKARITLNQTIEDALLLNKELDPHAVLQKTRARLYWFGRDLDPSREGLSLAGNSLEWRGAGDSWRREVETRGLHPHEVDNLLASVGALQLCGVDPDHSTALFQRPIRLPHRIEDLGVFAGVRFLNDSKATNCHSTLAALRSVQPGVVWLVGGQGKGEDLTELVHLAVEHGVRLVVCFGRDGAHFAEALTGRIETRLAPTLKEAFPIAVAEARPGETVLLSPAAASFDEFQSFEDRGDHFRRWVAELMEAPR